MYFVFLWIVFGALIAALVINRALRGHPIEPLGPIVWLLTWAFFALVGIGLSCGIGALMPKVVDVDIFPLYGWGTEAEPIYLMQVDGGVEYIPLPKDGEMPTNVFVGDGEKIVIVTIGADQQPRVEVTTTRFASRWMEFFGTSNKVGRVFKFYVPGGSVKYDLPFQGG